MSREDAVCCEKCGSKNITRDEDVLDTWFSSALWPFETLGWPDKTADLDYFYPTDVLVTGYDIIFFWVARMIFSGCKQMGKTPFHTVLIHGLVRDDKGRKMSKSLGNGIDPIEMIDKYGADALRMNMITGNSPGNDMRFYVERCEAMRNFANKIWNASRFVMMNLSIEKPEFPAIDKLEMEDKWILSKLNDLAAEVTENMDKFELGIAVQKVYDFIWDSFCDWYIELTKPRMTGDDMESRVVAEQVLVYVLTETLKLLHPFMPFITEEIWQAMPHEGEALIIAKWPEYRKDFEFRAQEQTMEHIMGAIKAVRARRSEMNVPPSKKAKLVIITDMHDEFRMGEAFIKKLAYANEIELMDKSPEDVSGMVSCVTNVATCLIPLAELVDFEKELERINKELANAEKGLAGVRAKLANEKFVSKAPENVVAAEKEKEAKYIALIENLNESKKQMQK